MTGYRPVKSRSIPAMEHGAPLAPLPLHDVEPIAGQRVSVFDFLTSAWTAPENLRYQIIRDRHDKGADLPYVPETARILVNVAQACGELIGGQEAGLADEPSRKMIRWYRDHMIPGNRQALEAHRSERAPSSD